MRKIDQKHHDGHGLNDLLIIEADDRDPEAGNASHAYIGTLDLSDHDHAEFREVLNVQLQHGPRHEPDSKPGALDAALIAILLDRYEGFQSGPYRCRENALVITKLEEALHWMQHRTNERARRGVLGTKEK